MRAIALVSCVMPALLALAPTAMAQDATATLRIRGSVMVSSGGEFITARDGQVVIAGQRILVGDNASATVEYDRDCKRSFDTAGVHLIPPARCEDDNDNDRDDEDRSQEREQQSAEQGGSAEGSVATASGTSQLATLAVALGGVVAGAGLMEQREESPPDHPVSR